VRRTAQYVITGCSAGKFGPYAGVRFVRYLLGERR
jgi:uncharacterized membrane protein YjgN (DUF898 family)